MNTQFSFSAFFSSQNTSKMKLLFISLLSFCLSCTSVNAQRVIIGGGPYFAPATEGSYNVVTIIGAFPLKGLSTNARSASLATTLVLIPAFKTTNVNIGVQHFWNFEKFSYILNPRLSIGLYGNDNPTSAGFSLFQRFMTGKFGLNCFWQEHWNKKGHLNGNLTFDLDYTVYNKGGEQVTIGVSANVFNPQGVSNMQFNKLADNLSFGPILGVNKSF
jgi:hypothetical protein